MRLLPGYYQESADTKKEAQDAIDHAYTLFVDALGSDTAIQTDVEPHPKRHRRSQDYRAAMCYAIPNSQPEALVTRFGHIS